MAVVLLPALATWVAARDGLSFRELFCLALEVHMLEWFLGGDEAPCGHARQAVARLPEATNVGVAGFAESGYPVKRG